MGLQTCQVLYTDALQSSVLLPPSYMETETRWRSHRNWQGRELWDSNPGLAYSETRALLSSCCERGMEQREISLPRPYCQHRQCPSGIPSTRMNEVRANPTAQKCLWTVSSFLTRSYKDCPGAPKAQKWNLISQSLNLSVEFNAIAFPSSHFTLSPPTATYQLNNKVSEYGLYK